MQNRKTGSVRANGEKKIPCEGGVQEPWGCSILSSGYSAGWSQKFFSASPMVSHGIFLSIWNPLQEALHERKRLITANCELRKKKKKSSWNDLGKGIPIHVQLQLHLGTFSVIPKCWRPWHFLSSVGLICALFLIIIINLSKCLALLSESVLSE